LISSKELDQTKELKKREEMDELRLEHANLSFWYTEEH